MEELQAEHERCEGSGNARGLATGSLFKLVDYPREDQNREYLVVSVAYNLCMDAHISSGSSGGGLLFDCSFTAIDQTETYRPPRITHEPIIHGAQTAMVVGPEGEEIYTDK
jgi:type VI secretion system secreted protein VgrG